MIPNSNYCRKQWAINERRKKKQEVKMNFDITYCSKINCKNVKCERHQKTINYAYLGNRPISIANFEKCEFWEVEDE